VNTLLNDPVLQTAVVGAFVSLLASAISLYLWTEQRGERYLADFAAGWACGGLRWTLHYAAQGHTTLLVLEGIFLPATVLFLALGCYEVLPSKPWRRAPVVGVATGVAVIYGFMAYVRGIPIEASYAVYAGVLGFGAFCMWRAYQVERLTGYQFAIAAFLWQAGVVAAILYWLGRALSDNVIVPLGFNTGLMISIVMIAYQRSRMKLRESEQTLQKIFDVAPTSIVITRPPEGKIERANSVALELFGATAEAVIGRTSVEQGLVGDAASREHLYAELHGGRSVRGHDMVVLRDGKEPRFLAVNADRIDLQSGERHIFSYYDLTGLRRAEEELRASADALRASELNYRELVDGVRDVIFAVSADGLITSLNEAFETITGWKREEWVGQPFLGLLHADDRSESIELLQAVVLDAPRPDASQLRIRTRDNKFVVGEFRTNPQRKEGRVVGVFGIMRDVTERLILEEQFHQSQKMEAVGRLAGGVAHDFNNLLTAILGYCELLLTDLKSDDPRRDDITEIQKAGTSASGLTRQLLAFSRKQIIEPTLLDLNAIVADMRAMLGRLIGEDVKVALALRPGLVRIQADRGQVEQIVLNLAVNARDAMPNGGTLTLATANVELDEHDAATLPAVKPGRYAVLTVSDTGTGMTPAVQARLFEPFFTTKEVGKGTGLGLATVNGIVMRYGGRVNVDSEVGRGTSFHVHLPATAATETVVTEALRIEPRGGTETVLVVEDADGLRELAKRLLTRQGYTVLVARSADEALRLFEQHASIDVLLTDVVMPGTSGPELTARLIQQRRAVTVIYMSGYTEEAIVQHGVLKPGIFFLNKPFTSETLGQKIREALDQRQIPNSLPPVG
jgi:PAS domain S-box-containing protein